MPKYSCIELVISVCILLGSGLLCLFLFFVTCHGLNVSPVEHRGNILRVEVMIKNISNLLEKQYGNLD